MTAPSPWFLAGAAALGGAFGALVRHAFNQGFAGRALVGVPMATLMVNVFGCFMAGLLLVWIDQRVAMATHAAFWRALLMTGVIGGLTTFSAFGVELWTMLRSERYLLMAATIAAHVVVGVAAIALGWRVGRTLWPT